MRFLTVKQNGGDWYLWVEDDEGPLTGYALDDQRVANLINALNKASVNGATWPIYDISDR
jgi:hypothetical protein